MLKQDESTVIDFHIHPGPAWLPTERRLHNSKDPLNSLQVCIDAMDVAGIDKAVVMLLDDDWFTGNAGAELLHLVALSSWADRLTFCAMFDFFRIFETDEMLECISRAAVIGVRGIKIHPVIQRITHKDFPVIKQLASHAQKQNMFIVVHAFSDEPEKFENVGLDIIGFLAPYVQSPLVIAHAGGIDFSRAISLARKYPNVYIDLSYFLFDPNYLDLIGLLGWGIKLLGAERFLYGSDHPSVNILEYKEKLIMIIEKAGCSKTEIAAILGQNAFRILTMCSLK